MFLFIRAYIMCALCVFASVYTHASNIIIVNTHHDIYNIYCVWICIRVQCAEERNANQCAKNYKEKPRTCLWDIDAQAERYHRSISTYFHFDWLLAKSFGDPLIYICTHTERTRSFFLLHKQGASGFPFFLFHHRTIYLSYALTCVYVVCVLCCAVTTSRCTIYYSIYTRTQILRDVHACGARGIIPFRLNRNRVHQQHCHNQIPKTIVHS